VPTYAYACTECDHRFEAVQSFSDDSLTVCPECEGRLRKVFDERWCLKVQAHFLVCPQRHLQRAEVASFIEWIRENAAESESAGVAASAVVAGLA